MRQPFAAELRDWSNRLVQGQGDAQLLSEPQAPGTQVFNSAQYAARNRADGEYVRDLYGGYPQRELDSPGLAYWTNQITACGMDQQCRQAKRVDMRLAFA